MAKVPAIHPNTKTLFKLLTQRAQWPAHHLFSWLLEDVLADLSGQRKPYPPPVEAIPIIRELAENYAYCVAKTEPFTDLLSGLFMEIVCPSDQKYRGQFFTPSGVAQLLAELAFSGDPGPPPEGRLWRVCEPACGAGGLLMAAIQNRLGHGADTLRHWSFTAIDLDLRCAQMTAIQVLANTFIHQVTLGELVVYQGNALASGADWQVIAHAIAPTVVPEICPPALHPARIEAVQAAAQSCTLDLFCLPIEADDDAQAA